MADEHLHRQQLSRARVVHRHERRTLPTTGARGPVTAGPPALDLDASSESANPPARCVAAMERGCQACGAHPCCGPCEPR